MVLDVVGSNPTSRPICRKFISHSFVASRRDIFRASFSLRLELSSLADWMTSDGGKERDPQQVSANLTAARQEYLKALAARSEACQIKAALDPANSDGSAALRAANRQVSIASLKFERALNEFIAVTCVRRGAG